MVRPISHVILLSGLLALVAGSAGASAPASELEFRRHVDSLVQNGRLGYDQGLLARFQRVFAPGLLPVELRNADAAPVKSATGLVQEYRSIRDGLPPNIVAQISAYLTESPSALARTHETEHFRFTYETSGPNAVPATDADANGVPDFVDRVGAWAELSWSRLFVETGFTAPPLANGKYRVSFREMESYGYTVPDDGTTRIVLHRDYEGFPENRDPQGSSRGAAKVSTAHELKHASQFATSRWSEGGWLEADATWAEDFVFDETDDYLRYLPEGSPVSHPDSWLATGASYEDCLWPRLLVERHGVSALVDFFERRAERSGEPVMTSFDEALAAYRSSVAGEARQLGLWSYFCGGNAAGRPIGFEEAAAYPTPPFHQVLSDPAETVSETLPDLGCHYVFVSGQNRSGRPTVAFSGDRNIPFALHAIVLTEEGTRSVHEIPVNGSDSTPTEVPIEWEGLPFLIVSVSNLNGSGPGDDYFLSVDDENAVGVGPLASGGAFALEPNRPNPFRQSTEISFSLPAANRVRLAIYDVAGRLVQRILEGERLPAGRHGRRWDGIDQGGRAAAPGVYYYRLEAGEHSATRRLLLLR